MANVNDDEASVPPSETTAWSQITYTTSKPDLARVFIRLKNGVKVLVPLPQTSTLQNLHERALQRAEKFGLNASQDTTFLQTTGRSPVALHGEDLLLDILDLTDDNTFDLYHVEDIGADALALRSCLPFRTNADDLVYLRWVSLEDALSHSQISSIKTDHAAVPQDTPLGQIYDIATDKFTSTPQSSKTLPCKVQLYLKECKLSAESNPTTLQELGLFGSRTSPLDVFVDLVPAVQASTSIAELKGDTGLETIWGFSSTKRGICAFTTSLKILMKELEDDEKKFEDFLEVLFELTHFPPLIIAFRSLCQSNFLEQAAYSSSLRLVASVFHVLCLQIAPSAICTSSDQALESSRQLISWIYVQKPGISEEQDKCYSWAHKVSIVEKTDNDAVMTTLLLHAYEVKITLVSPSDISTSGEKILVVALAHEDESTANMLGRCIHEQYTSPFDYYLTFEYSKAWSKLLHHKKVLVPQPSEYDTLLESTALSSEFKMVGPFQLSDCLAFDLPVITLSTEGLVSLYEQEDYDCGQKRFFTWNVIQKKEVMPDQPAQHLIQKLEPIIAERKKENNWETDAWGDWTASADFRTPTEAVVVCMDTSGSMSYSMPESWLLLAPGSHHSMPSRLTEVKEFFKNFALRISALQLSTFLGLVTFSAKTQVVARQQLTPVHLNFEEQVERIQPESQTAIFNGLCKAKNMLCELRNMYPNTKARIILLTDGDEISSDVRSETVARYLHAHDIVLDSLVIGTDSTHELFKISKMTGGYAFKPSTQQAFFQIFLLETMIDIRTRPDIIKVPCNPAEGWFAFTPKAADMSTPFDIPPCRAHPSQNDSFIALADADRYLARQATGSTKSVYSSSTHSMSTRSRSSNVSGAILGAGGSTKVFLAEVKEQLKNPHDDMDVYVSESNMGFWKIAMNGPSASAYAGGVFILWLEIGYDFPLKPPAVRFITPMLHPNITKHGRVCHPILNREWAPTIRIYQVLQHIYGILMSLEARDAVDPLSTLKFYSNPTEGEREVREYVQRFALKSRATIRAELAGDDDASTVTDSLAESWDVLSTDSKNTKTHRIATREPLSGVSPPPSYHSPTNTPRVCNRGGNISSDRFTALRSTPPPLIAAPGQGLPYTPLSNLTPGDGPRRFSRRASFFKKMKK